MERRVTQARWRHCCPAWGSVAPACLRLRVRQAQGAGTSVRAQSIFARSCRCGASAWQLEDTFARSLRAGRGPCRRCAAGSRGLFSCRQSTRWRSCSRRCAALGHFPLERLAACTYDAHSGGGQAHADAWRSPPRYLGLELSLSSEGARAPLESTTDRAATSLSLHVDRVRVSALSIFLSYSSRRCRPRWSRTARVGASDRAATCTARDARRVPHALVRQSAASFRAMELEHRSVVGASAAECGRAATRGAAALPLAGNRHDLPCAALCRSLRQLDGRPHGDCGGRQQLRAPPIARARAAQRR